jgi:hypothetical protein
MAVGLAVWMMIRPKSQSASANLATKLENPSLKEILAMTPNELAQVDIALMNLRCAEGLRGSEGLDVAAARKTLDQFARHVKEETERHRHRFEKNPEEYQNSEPYFRLMMMAVVLQEDGTVHYNPARITEPGHFEANSKFFANSKDVFLPGLIGPPMSGTCASLPVLYVAVGRRLGYPLCLVTTKNHLFVRWDDGRMRMNMDATGHGFTSESDEYYKTWPYKITTEEVAANGYLKSMTPNEELACFMSLRGRCFFDGMGHYKQGIEAHREAFRLAPHVPAYRVVLDMSVEMLQARRAQQMMWLLDKADTPNMPPPPPGLFPRPSNR